MLELLEHTSALAGLIDAWRQEGPTEGELTARRANCGREVLQMGCEKPSESSRA